MVDTLLAHPEAHGVAANIVNSPLTHWLHYHSEAVLPYLPLSNQDDPQPLTTWRASVLPRWSGYRTEIWEFPDRPDGRPFDIGEVGGPPSRNHRWLPMARTSENLMVTPIAAGREYNPFGRGWTEWTMAAQQHYSLLDNIEHENLGKSVKLMKVGGDDEESLTVTIPRALKRPCLVDTHAIVAHFGFRTTPELEQTDLLERYRLYANEKVCTKDNQRHKLESWYSEQYEIDI